MANIKRLLILGPSRGVARKLVSEPLPSEVFISPQGSSELSNS